MKFVLLSDIHATSTNPIARKDTVRETLYKKFKFVFSYAEKYKACILQAGDLSDKPRDWFILDMLIDLFNEYPTVKMFSVKGQHDMYMRSTLEETPTTMNLLIKTGKIVYLNAEAIKIANINIYGASWGDKIITPKGKNNVLVTHHSVSREAIYPKHKFSTPTKFALNLKNYRLILVGDVHRKFFEKVNNTKIVNTGPMFRKECEEYNFKHKPCFFVWDSKTFFIKKIEIPHELAKKVLTRIHINNKIKNERSDESLDKIIGKIKTSGLPTLKMKEILIKVINKCNANKRTIKVINEVMQIEN